MGNEKCIYFSLSSHRRSDAVLDNGKWTTENGQWKMHLFFLVCPAEEVTLCGTMKNGQCKMFLSFLVRPAEEVTLCWTMKKFF